jgi:ribose/xylose/arabinose/galactoside ABC-type transport system permease subunit
MEKINKSNIGNIYKKFNREWGTQFSLFLAFIVIAVVFAFASPYFLLGKNLSNIGHNMAIMGIMAAGLTVPMILGCMDVSQYSINALVGVTCVLFANMGLPIGLVLLYAVVAGTTLGVLNGVVVAILRINPIIATLSTGMVMRGFCYMLTEGKTLSVNNPAFKLLGRGSVIGIPNTLLIMFGVFLLIYIMLKHTPFGRKLFAVGGNPQAAFLSGINVRTIRFGGFMISGAAAGLAGFLLLSQLGAFQPNAGEATLMNVIAAVILGGLSLSGGKAKLTGTFIGVLILTVISNGMNLLGVQSYYQTIVRGMIILVAVYLDVIRGGGYK